MDAGLRGHPGCRDTKATACFPTERPSHPERFARWIDLPAVSDGLDAAALDELKGAAIQTQVLNLTAIAEGLHRRLFSDSAEARRFPQSARGSARKPQKAARDAAVAVLAGDQFTDDDRDEFGQAVSEALAHINERTFRSRMQELVDVAEHAVPGITDSFKDSPGAVVHARNTLAHRGTQSLGDELKPSSNYLSPLGTHCAGFFAPCCWTAPVSTHRRSRTGIGTRRSTVTTSPTSDTTC